MVLRYTIDMIKNKKLLIVLLICVCALLAAAVALLCFINIKGDKPDKVVVKTENDVVVIDANNVSNGNGYIFKFKNDDTEVKIDSTYGIIETSTLSDVLEFGKTYQISVCVKGEVEGGNSIYSDPINWIATKALDAPVISIKNQKLVFNEVQGADYYQVFYNPNGDAKSLRFEENEIILSKLDGGVFDVFVKAYSNNKNLLQSKSSNVLSSVTNIHQLQKPQLVQLDQNTKILSIYLEDVIDKVELYVGTSYTEYTSYVLTAVYCADMGDLYKASCDIGFLYNSDKVYGIKLIPGAYDKYTEDIYWVK